MKQKERKRRKVQERYVSYRTLNFNGFFDTFGILSLSIYLYILLFAIQY